MKSKRLFEPVERQISSSSVMGWLVPTEAQRESIARALGEVGQTRTWNLKLDVIARKREIRAGGNGAPKIRSRR